MQQIRTRVQRTRVHRTKAVIDYDKFAERVNGRCATFGIVPAMNTSVEWTSDYILWWGICLIVTGASLKTINEPVENEELDSFEKYLGRNTMLFWGVLIIHVLK
jgi:hypothetical protein